MSAETSRWYRSKVDAWLVPVLCLPPLAAVAACVLSAAAGSRAGVVIGVVTAVGVAAVYLGLVFPMRYGIDGDHLVVRFGLCRRRIPLAAIDEVRPTSNPLASPALSLDRLAIRFGDGPLHTLLISPADRPRFLDDLARKAALNREGDRLIRA